MSIETQENEKCELGFPLSKFSKYEMLNILQMVDDDYKGYVRLVTIPGYLGIHEFRQHDGIMLLQHILDDDDYIRDLYYTNRLKNFNFLFRVANLDMSSMLKWLVIVFQRIGSPEVYFLVSELLLIILTLCFDDSENFHDVHTFANLFRYSGKIVCAGKRFEGDAYSYIFPGTFFNPEYDRQNSVDAWERVLLRFKKEPDECIFDYLYRIKEMTKRDIFGFNLYQPLQVTCSAHKIKVSSYGTKGWAGVLSCMFDRSSAFPNKSGFATTFSSYTLSDSFTIEYPDDPRRYYFKETSVVMNNPSLQRLINVFEGLDVIKYCGVSPPIRQFSFKLPDHLRLSVIDTHGESYGTVIYREREKLPYYEWIEVKCHISTYCEIRTGRQNKSRLTMKSFNADGPPCSMMRDISEIIRESKIF